MTDPYNLERFVTAQQGVFPAVLRELSEGRKQTHWMWFVFPQLRRLGHSSMAQFYGIESLDEASAYLGHDLLGPRLAQCTRLVLEARALSLREMFGSPDDMKFRSSMTIFALTLPLEQNPYRQALEKWCDGKMDEESLRLLGQ